MGRPYPSCDKCQSAAEVIDSRTATDMGLVGVEGVLKELGGYVPYTAYRRRRYKCIGCGHRWTSVEVHADHLLEVFKAMVAALGGEG